MIWSWIWFEDGICIASYFVRHNQTCVQMDWEWDGLVKCTMGQSILVLLWGNLMFGYTDGSLEEQWDDKLPPERLILCNSSVTMAALNILLELLQPNHDLWMKTLVGGAIEKKELYLSALKEIDAYRPSSSNPSPRASPSSSMQPPHGPQVRIFEFLNEGPRVPFLDRADGSGVFASTKSRPGLGELGTKGAVKAVMEFLDFNRERVPRAE
ncbi:hypothetical protein MRB53_021100 [Persea americana]|uniref:Uncharacterized protein n=1 Tax=Persea americana TaxID=3435 RepID=A0ACC2L439_PERAE|nr:hypothetical protein MRB53_021100 [Persea americana]